MADTVMAAMMDEGVRFYLGTSVESVVEKNSHKEVTFTDDNGESITIEGEALLVAMGRAPNVGDMGLKNIGVTYTGKGIEVDNRMRTNHKHIYAAGDITGKYQFTHAAGYEGGIVISNAIFHLPRKADYTFLPWCTFTGPELASIGLNEKSAKKKGIKYSVWTEEFSGNDRALAEGNTTGKIKMLLNEKEKVIGVQIAGPRAGDDHPRHQVFPQLSRKLLPTGRTVVVRNRPQRTHAGGDPAGRHPPAPGRGHRAGQTRAAFLRHALVRQ